MRTAYALPPSKAGAPAAKSFGETTCTIMGSAPALVTGDDFARVDLPASARIGGAVRVGARIEGGLYSGAAGVVGGHCRFQPQVAVRHVGKVLPIVRQEPKRVGGIALR